MVVYSWFHKRKKSEQFGEKFPHPSLTNELDNEPIGDIIARFLSNGYLPSAPNTGVDATALVDGKAVDDAFAHLEGTETSDLSKVEQAEVLADAVRLAEQLRDSQQAKQSEKSVISEPGTQSQKASATDDLKEGKAE